MIPGRNGLDVAAASYVKELDLAINPAACEEEIIHWREGDACAATAWVCIQLGLLWSANVTLIGKLTAKGLLGPR